MWTVEFLDQTVISEFKSLPDDQIARFFRLVTLIREFGLDGLGPPHVKHIEGKLWEMRLKGRDGISRALYVTAKPQRVVVVLVFVKKTQETPQRQIRLALKRAATVA